MRWEQWYGVQSSCEKKIQTASHKLFYVKGVIKTIFLYLDTIDPPNEINTYTCPLDSTQIGNCQQSQYLQDTNDFINAICSPSHVQNPIFFGDVYPLHSHVLVKFPGDLSESAVGPTEGQV